MVEKPQFITQPFTEEIVWKELLSLHTRKATGPDGIPALFLKIAADVVAKPLTYLFNKSIGTSTFPSD